MACCGQPYPVCKRQSAGKDINHDQARQRPRFLAAGSFRHRHAGGGHRLLLTFSSILLPFVAGMALAYFLDPVADRLERLGLSRMMATVLILVSFVVIFVLSLVIIIPVLVTQLNDFITNIPDYVSQLQALIAKSTPPGYRNG